MVVELLISWQLVLTYENAQFVRVGLANIDLARVAILGRLRIIKRHKAVLNLLGTGLQQLAHA
jgi:hypothetical protein